MKPKCKRVSRSATLRNLNLRHDRQEKNTVYLGNPTIFTSTMKNRRSVSNFLRFFPNKSWASAQRLACFSKFSSSFLWSQARGIFKATAGPSASSCKEIFHICHFKKNNYCGKGVEHHTLVLPEKNWKRSVCFSEVIIDFFYHYLHEEKARGRTT